MSERKILFEIELQNEDALKNAEKFQKEIDRLKQQQKTLQQQLKEGSITYDEYTAALVRNQAELRLNQKALQQTNRFIDNTIKANAAAVGSYEQLSAQYEILKSQINKLGAAEGAELEAKQALEEQAKLLYNEMNRLQMATGKAVLNVGNYEEAIRNVLNDNTVFSGTLQQMRDQLKQLTEALQNVPVGSKAFEEIKNKSDQLRLAIGQAEGKLNEFGEAEPKNPAKKTFEDAFEAAGAFTNALQLANVLGKDNAAVAEVQAKATQAIAVAQTTANIVKAKGAIIDTAMLVKTKALAVAQRLLALAVGQSTGAMKALRIALVSTGIGAIVVGIGLLVANFKEVSGWIERTRQKFRDFIAGLVGSQEAAKWLAFSIEAIISPITLLISGIKELGKLTGIVEVQKVTTDIDALNQALERSESAFKRQNKALENQIILARASGKNQKEISELEIELLKRKANQWQKYDKYVQQHIENIKKSGRSLTDDEQKALDDFNEKVAQAQLELAVKEAEISKERNDKANDIAKQRKEIERQLNDEIRALRVSLINDEFERQKAEVNLQLEQQRQAAALQIDELKKQGVLTESIRAEINEKLQLQEQQANAQLLKIEQDRIKKQEEAEKQAAERREQLYSQTVDGRLEASQKAAELEIEYLRTINSNIEGSQSERVARLRQLAIQELEIRKKSIEDQLRIILEFSQKIGGATEEEAKKIEELKNQLASLTNELNNLQQSGNKPTFGEFLGIDKGSLDKAIASIQQIQSLFGQLNEAINLGYQARLNEIDSEYQAREEAIRNSTMSEKKKQKVLEKLERERALKRWEIEKEQFEVNQATAIINATIQGALAIVTAFAQLGVIAGAIATPIIIATTAAQIATIANQPPPPKPQFFEGGFTEMSGNPYLKSHKGSNNRRDVHHNEYVVPWRVLKNEAALPHVAALEMMRRNTAGRLGISGFADGGFVRSQIEANAMNTANISEAVKAAVKNIQIVTKVTDIMRVSNEMNTNVVRAKL